MDILAFIISMLIFIGISAKLYMFREEGYFKQSIISIICAQLISAGILIQGDLFFLRSTYLVFAMQIFIFDFIKKFKNRKLFFVINMIIIAIGSKLYVIENLGYFRKGTVVYTSIAIFVIGSTIEFINLQRKLIKLRKKIEKEFSENE